MGCISGMFRTTGLLAHKLDLEYEEQLINETRMGVSKSISDLVTAGTDMDADSPVAQQLSRRKENLYLLEKKLTMRAEYIKRNLEMMNTELNSLSESVSKDIQKTFSYGRQAG